MNILYTLTSYPPSTGGAQQHFHEIARRMAVTDSVRVVRQWDVNRQDWLLGSTLRAPHLQPATLDGVSVRGLDFSVTDRVSMSPALPLFYPLPEVFTPWVGRVFLNRLREGLAKNPRPNVIHHGRIGRENLAYASLHLARELGVPFVLTPFHHPRWVGWRYREWLKIYREADHVCALTESERETLVGLGVKADRVSVVGHGPSVLRPDSAAGEKFRSKHSLSRFPVILFLGQKYEYKGFRSLVESAPQVWKRHPDARFVFVGPRTAESTAFFEGFRDSRILELPSASLEEKCAALQACDVFCMPSVQESFGGVYVEAWMYKKPVIGGRIPAIASVIDEGKNGWLVGQEASDIAARVLDLLENPERAREFGEAGYAKAVSTYTWDVITGRVRGIYEGLIG